MKQVADERNVKSKPCRFQGVVSTYIVSFAAVFWMSRHATLPQRGGALRDIQKTAAKETISTRRVVSFGNVLHKVDHVYFAKHAVAACNTGGNTNKNAFAIQYCCRTSWKNILPVLLLLRTSLSDGSALVQRNRIIQLRYSWNYL